MRGWRSISPAALSGCEPRMIARPRCICTGRSCSPASRQKRSTTRSPNAFRAAAEGDGFPQASAGQLFVRLVEVQVAVVSQGILQGDLVACGTAFDQLIEGGKVLVEGPRPQAEALQHGMRAVAVVIAGFRVPAAGEGVDAHHGVVVPAERLARIEERIAIGIGDHPLDAGAPEDFRAPSRLPVMVAHRGIERAPVVPGDPAFADAVDFGHRADEIADEGIRSAVLQEWRQRFPGRRAGRYGIAATRSAASSRRSSAGTTAGGRPRD